MGNDVSVDDAITVPHSDNILAIGKNVKRHEKDWDVLTPIRHHFDWRKYHIIYCLSHQIIYGNVDRNDYYLYGNTYYCHDTGVDSVNRALKNFLKTHKIKKICANVSGYSTFWITQNNEIYAHGLNIYQQLGFDHDMVNRWNCKVINPSIVKYFSNFGGIKDIQCSSKYTLLLCSFNKQVANTICLYLYNRIVIPVDILNLIVLFCGINGVYTTDFSHNGEEKKINGDGWRPINVFRDKNIIKIRSGYEHSLFLESNGNVWCVGDNKYKQLGLRQHKKTQKIPVRIEYLLHKIKIKNISCGFYHNLAISYDGKIYAWGDNTEKQCVHDSAVLKMIHWFRKYTIECINCGAYHSHCKSTDDKHYLWGSNANNECIGYQDKDVVSKPYCINKLMNKIAANRKIRSIALGQRNTYIALFYQL